MKEFLKNNQSILVICGIVSILIIAVGFIFKYIESDIQNNTKHIAAVSKDMTTNYVTQTRYYSFTRANNDDIKANKKSIDAVSALTYSAIAEVSKQTFKNAGWINAYSTLLLHSDKLDK